MPSAEKINRGNLLIQALLPEIRIFEGNAVKSFCNWQTNYSDYCDMLHVARKVADSGVRIHIDEIVYSAEVPSQFAISGVIMRPGTISIDTVLDKTVDKIYERELSNQGVSDEEMQKIIKQAELSGSNLEEVWELQVIPRLPRTKEQIRSSLLTKLSRNI